MREVSRTLEQATDLPTLADQLSQTIQQVMHVRGACSLLPDGDKLITGLAGQPEMALFGSLCLEPNNVLIQYLQKRSSPVTKIELFHALNATHLSPQEVHLLGCEQISLLIPIRGRHNALGLLVLGSKYGKNKFQAHDLEILELIAHQASMAFERAQLITELNRQAKMSKVYQQQALSAREEERKHVARELHDEVIQSLVALKYSWGG